MSTAASSWKPVVVRGGEDAGEPASRAVRVTPAAPEAAAAAAASPVVVVDEVGNRGGAHQGVPATVHPGERASVPARPPAPARVRKTTVMLGGAVLRELSTGLARDADHGPPWEERPPALTQLRTSIHVRAAAHDILPFVKGCYIAWGYTFELPVTAIGYTGLWLAQSPARVAIVVIVWTILHACGLAPQLPLIGLIPGIRDII